MNRLQERAERIAGRVQADIVRRLTDDFAEANFNGRVEAMADGVVLSGRGLMRRWLESPQLRFLTGGRR